ncbi:MAG: hypothetical protein COS98_01145, partial [Parcubacteria group bacterium CG07_land_8_20_14_0_80_35_11]
EKHTEKEIWESTISTFLSKFIFALTFMLPALFLELSRAIWISIIWGLSLLCIFSFKLARDQKTKPWRVVGEHLIIAFIVIVLTHYIGDWISSMFTP